MGQDKNLREFSMNVISCFTICVKHELCECQYSLFFVILSEKLTRFDRVHVKLLTIRELGMNGISQFRSEVKHDSVKC